jgi:ABC-type nitrate/sulfonate/bicarbonate transport system substrate-binding protein
MHRNRNYITRRAAYSVGLVVVFVRFLFPAPVFAQEKASQLPPETPRVRIAYTSLSGNMAPLWVAGEKGYFKEYGLTVDQLYTRTVSGTQAVLSGDVQLIYGACAQVMSARRAGADLVLIASTIHYNPYALVSHYSKNDSQQLLGKRIAVNQLQDAIHVSARVALQRVGVNPDAVIYVPIGSTPDRLVAAQTGVTEAAMYGGPLEVPIERGMNVLVDLFEQKIPYCGGGIGVSENFLKRYPRAVEAFLRGFLKGNAYCFNGNRNTVKATLARILKLNVTEKKTDQIYQYLKNNAKYPAVTPEGVVATIDILSQQDRSWLNLKPELFYDNTILKKLDKEGFVEAVHRDVR